MRWDSWDTWDLSLFACELHAHMVLPSRARRSPHPREDVHEPLHINAPFFLPCPSTTFETPFKTLSPMESEKWNALLVFLFSVLVLVLSVFHIKGYTPPSGVDPSALTRSTCSCSCSSSSSSSCFSSLSFLLVLVLVFVVLHLLFHCFLLCIAWASGVDLVISFMSLLPTYHCWCWFCHLSFITVAISDISLLPLLVLMLRKKIESSFQNFLFLSIRCWH